MRPWIRGSEDDRVRSIVGDIRRFLIAGRAVPPYVLRNVPITRKPRRLAPIHADATGRGLRALHGEHGLDRHRDVASGHSPRPAPRPHHAETRDDVLPPEPRGVHPGQRMGSGSVRGSIDLPRRHRGVHVGIHSLRPIEFADSLHCGSCAAGPRWRHDGAGGSARALALRASRGTRHRPCLSHHSGPHRSDRRAATRRLHHHLFRVALDFLDQRSDRRSRRDLGDLVHRRHPGDRRLARSTSQAFFFPASACRRCRSALRSQAGLSCRHRSPWR